MNDLNIWDQYEKIKDYPIGSGIYGIVYKVKNIQTGDLYALKEIKKSQCYIKFDELSEELNIMKKINPENNISINLIDTKESLYIIMDLCEYSLKGYIERKNNPISIDEIKFVLTQLNDIFKIMIKEKEYINITLNNILISLDRLDKCLIKFVDYGSNKCIIKRETTGIAEENWTESPEVLNGEEKNPKSDIWSLGTIIYYMLFKEFPFQGIGEIPTLQNINSNRLLKQCSNGKLNDLLNKMLKIDIEERISWEDYFNHPFFNQDTFEFNCDKHLKIINYYCKECGKNVCEDCLKDQEHSNHQIIPFNNIGLSENEINRMENLFKDIDNKLNSFNKIRKEIEYLLTKMKLIKENKLIYENNMDNNYKEYYIKYLENINKILENNEIKLIDLMPNEIVCIYDIKKDWYDKDDYIKEPIRILNCYEEAKRDGWYLKEVENNEKEIKGNCELYLNDNKIDFCYKYTFPQEGKYTIKIKFKKSLTNTNCMFIDCKKLISIDLSNFNTSNINNMSNMFYNCSSLVEFKLSNYMNNNVKNMCNMFYNCSSLKSLNLSNFTNNNVINMSYMFNNCCSLISLNLTNFYTSDVINMWNIFYGMKSDCEIISNDKNIKEEINYLV